VPTTTLQCASQRYLFAVAHNPNVFLDLRDSPLQWGGYDICTVQSWWERVTFGLPWPIPVFIGKGFDGGQKPVDKALWF